MVKDIIRSNQEQLFRIIYVSIIFAYKKQTHDIYIWHFCYLCGAVY